MLYTLLYSSVAVFAMSEDEIGTLLARSRERNAAEDVTGLLVYLRLDLDRAAFVQVLEGPRQAVEETYARIERDELHQDLTVLSRTPTETSRFRQWSMKYLTLDEAALRDVVGSRAGHGSEVAGWLRDRAVMDRVITAVGGD